MVSISTSRYVAEPRIKHGSPLSWQPGPRNTQLPIGYIRSGRGRYPIYTSISVDRLPRYLQKV
eukprot:2864578-Pleurochrysis_carterae.AAC.1